VHRNSPLGAGFSVLPIEAGKNAIRRLSRL
jgi:hypothetical protein